MEISTHVTSPLLETAQSHNPPEDSAHPLVAIWAESKVGAAAAL